MNDLPQQGSAVPSGRVSRQYATGALTALLVTASFIAGVFFGGLDAKPCFGASCPPSAGPGDPGEGRLLNKSSETPPDVGRDVDFGLFWDVWRMVKDRYADEPPSDIDMFYGAVGGMVASLEDPYSVFLDPGFAERFERELEGTFEGIGAEIGIKKGQLKVIAPLRGTPAERAGLKAGDAIVAIDGVDTVGMPVEDAVMRIRGEKGTEVTLLVFRDGMAEAKEIVIVRDTIVIESVKWAIERVDGKRLAVVTISHFNENTESKFNDAVRAILMEDPDGLILDLRNNPGGFLDTAVNVAGEWVHEDVVVVERFGDGRTTEHESSGIARLAHLPTVVLVNEGSASASEIVAGALRDHGKAVVVGKRTFGKGSVQDYVEFNDGSALKLTIAAWLTPNGTTIDKEGIAPDVEIELTPEDYDEDRDPQLDRAREILTADPEGGV